MSTNQGLAMSTPKQNVLFSVLFGLLGYLVMTSVCDQDIHGGIKMGIPNNFCDNGKDHLDVDWDNSTNKDYVCQRDEKYIPPYQSKAVPECLPEKNFPRPLHRCMTDKISYSDQPPRAGAHRPLWPVYGRYLYVPPQRWVHSLEHGAAVFLYHPCGDFTEIEKLVSVAIGCLRRHIISPYKALPLDKPYAVVTYGCRLLMSSVDVEAVQDYIKDYALKGPEKVARNGQYSYGLLEKSKIVKGSDQKDSNLCPGNRNARQNTAKDVAEKLQLDDGLDKLLRSLD